MTAPPGTAIREHEAADLDAGRADVRPVLRRLGEAGAFDPAGPDPTDALLPSVRVVRELATASLAAAFSGWSHRMGPAHLRCFRPPEPEAGLLPALQSAQVTGSTAVAPAISDLAGRGELPVVAVPDDDGWRGAGTMGRAPKPFAPARGGPQPLRRRGGGGPGPDARGGSPGRPVRADGAGGDAPAPPRPARAER